MWVLQQETVANSCIRLLPDIYIKLNTKIVRVSPLHCQSVGILVQVALPICQFPTS